MLFAPIGFASIEGSWNIVFLSYNEYPWIDYIIFLFDFDRGVELGDRDFLFGQPFIISSRVLEKSINVLPSDKCLSFKLNSFYSLVRQITIDGRSTNP